MPLVPLVPLRVRDTGCPRVLGRAARLAFALACLSVGALVRAHQLLGDLALGHLRGRVRTETACLREQFILGMPFDVDASVRRAGGVRAAGFRALVRGSALRLRLPTIADFLEAVLDGTPRYPMRRAFVALVRFFGALEGLFVGVLGFLRRPLERRAWASPRAGVVPSLLLVAGRLTPSTGLPSTALRSQRRRL